MPSIASDPLSSTSVNGSAHCAEFISSYAPFARAVVLDWIPAVEHQAAVSFTSRYIEKLATDVKEKDVQSPAVRLSGFSIFLDAMQTDANDHRGRPMVKCILLFCSESDVEIVKPGGFNSFVLPPMSMSGQPTQPDVTIIDDPGEILVRYTDCLDMLCEGAWDIGAFEAEYHGILFAAFDRQQDR